MESNANVIPKIVHQIWVGNVQPTEQQWKQIADTKAKIEAEGLQYVFWSNNNYPENVPDNIKIFAEACRSSTTSEINYGAFEADALRYLIMLRYGGLYLDCDYHLVRGIGELMNVFDGRPVFARLWPQRTAWPCNAFLGAPPNHPLYEFIVASLKAPTDGKPYYVGPAWLGSRLSDFYNEKIEKHDNESFTEKFGAQMLSEGQFLTKNRNNPTGYLEHKGWYTWRKRS